MDKEKAITLISLVVTIIILIILTGVSINLVLGENGLITISKKSKENMQVASNEEQHEIDTVLNEISIEREEIVKNNKANEPKLLTGMTPIKFTMPTEETMGETIITSEEDSEWYNYGTTYETRKWANAQTEDGSMWVWIPRFAYKITYANNSDKSKGGTIEVVFLNGTSDNYYDKNGKIQTAQRQTKVDQIIDTTANFTVHPAFTDESSINYANGGWDSELTGIWVAKFAAGYASGNNDAKVVASSVKYSQSISFVQAIERSASDKKDGDMEARNWLDGIYGSAKTTIKYPTFQGTTYVMNYISINDSYNISKALTNSGNIYGLNSEDADSHLMKNSEWGACAYLSQSIYGQNGKEITINNANLKSGNRKRTSTSGKTGVDSVYGVTGCTNNTTNGESITTTIDSINKISKNTANANGIYVWNQKTGQNASTTGTIYGIYDMSGCKWERTSSYIANNDLNLKKYGESLAYDEEKLKKESTKYTMVYPNNESGETNINTAIQKNFANNTKIYGDAIMETTGTNAGTSNTDWTTSSWNKDYSIFPALSSPFCIRSGGIWSNAGAGKFALSRSMGNNHYDNGFRAVIIGI